MINVTMQKPGTTKNPGRPKKWFSKPGEGYTLGTHPLLECDNGKCYVVDDKNTIVELNTRSIQIMPSAMKKDGLVVGNHTFGFLKDGARCAIWKDVRPGKETANVVCASKDYFKSPDWKPTRTGDE